jgi:hypothetical protein
MSTGERTERMDEGSIPFHGHD